MKTCGPGATSAPSEGEKPAIRPDRLRTEYALSPEEKEAVLRELGLEELPDPAKRGKRPAGEKDRGGKDAPKKDAPAGTK